MGMVVILLCFVIGTFIPVQSTIEEQVAMLSQDFFPTMLRFPGERNFDIPFDTFFSFWRASTPGFQMLAELPPHMKVPKIQAFCNSSQVTLLVDKRFNGVELSGDELQFGYGCYSNGDLENKLVFTYDVSQCGTNYLMQNGFEVFYNNLHFKPRKSLLKWWPTPFTVPISCIPNRSNNNPPNFVSVALPENDWSFSIKAMTPSWTHTESNIYQRGQFIHLQVTAKPGPDQRPFIQSCLVSASPNPQTRPRHAVIVNKGCTAPSGSHHAVTQFVGSRMEDSVNFILNTSQLSSEVYVHCSVVISDQGITSGSKSCNYNNIQSRWEELNGNVEVCKCCSSRCRGPSLKRLHVAAKAIVSTGPLIIVDKELYTRPVPSVPEPLDASSTPEANSVQSDTSDPAVTEYQTSSAAQSGSGAPDITKGTIASGASFSGSKIRPEAPWYTPPEAVVALSQDPGARLTLWLPGQRQFTAVGLDDKMGSPLESDVTVQLQLRDTLSNYIPEVYVVATDQDSLLNTPTNGIGKGLNKVDHEAPVWGVNAQSMVTGWVVPPPLEKAEESQRKLWGGGAWMPHTEAPQEGYKPLLHENMSLLGTSFNHEKDLLAQRQADTVMLQKSETTADLKPVIRSKLQFSKGIDGLQTLSYEEEVVRPEGGKDMSRRLGVDEVERKKQVVGQRRLLSTFLDLLRKLDKAE